MIVNQVSKLRASIHYLASDGNYTYIHFEKEPFLLYAITLSIFAKGLPGFVRIHKSFLINPVYVTDYRSRGRRSIEVLVGKQWLPVSRRRLDEVEAVLKQVEEMA